jgi:hypothetical protein
MDVVTLLDAAGVVVLVISLGLVGLAMRRRWLQRGGGTFDCSLRLPGGVRGKGVGYGKGWTLGVARYTGDRIDWYRVFSPSPRPRHSFGRRQLLVRGRRTPSGTESFALLAGAVVVECGVDGRTVELGMGEGELTGFLAWLEAAPPGQNVSVA